MPWGFYACSLWLTLFGVSLSLPHRTAQVRVFVSGAHALWAATVSKIFVKFLVSCSWRLGLGMSPATAGVYDCCRVRCYVVLGTSRRLRCAGETICRQVSSLSFGGRSFLYGG